jgi:hypothetical protein
LATRAIPAADTARTIAATEASFTRPIAATDTGTIPAPDPTGPIPAAADLPRKRRHATGAGRTVATTDPAGAIPTAADLAGKRGHATGAGRTIPAANATGPIAAAANLAGERRRATGAGRAIPTANATGTIAAAADLARERRRPTGAGAIRANSATGLRERGLRRDSAQARPVTPADTTAADPTGTIASTDLPWERRGAAGASAPAEPAGTIPATDLPGERRGAAGASAPAEPTGSVAPQATGSTGPLPRTADLAGAKRRSGPIGKATTGTARGAAAKLAGKRGRAPEPARAPAELPPRTVGPIEPAEISGLRRGAIEPTEIPRLRRRPRHPRAPNAPHARPAHAATERAGLRRRPVSGAWE